MKIKTKLLLLSGIVVVLVLSLIGIMYFRTSRIASGLVDTEAMQTVQHLSDAVDTYFTFIKSIGDNIAPVVRQLFAEDGSIDRKHLETALTDALNQNIKQDVFDLYAGIEKDGSTTGWDAPAAYDSRTRPWYRNAVAAGKTVVTPPYLDANTGKIILSTGTPIYGANNKLLGVIGIDVSLEKIGMKIRNAKVFGAGYGILLASDGLVLEHPTSSFIAEENLAKTSSNIHEDLAELGRQMIAGGSGFGDYEWQGSSRRLYYTTGEAGYVSALMFPKEQLSVIVRNATTVQIVIGVTAMVFLIVCMFCTILSITKPMRAVQVTAERMASLNLTPDPEAVKIVAKLNPQTELGSMVTAMRHMRDAFIDIVGSVRDEVKQLASSSNSLDSLRLEATTEVEDVGKSAVNVERLARDALSSVENTVLSVQEVTQAATMTAVSATRGAEASNATSELSASVAAMMNAFVEELQGVGVASAENRQGMMEVGSSVTAIAEFVITIRNIASQTNLLALNAAIEAARAGETGRGFAVVADEVRKLAEESNIASHHVAEMIEKLELGTRNAVTSTQESAEIIAAIMTRAKETQASLKNALTEIDKVNEAVQTIAAAAEEQAASSNEIAESSRQAQNSIGNVSNEISAISQSAGYTQEAIRKVAEEAENVAAISERLEEMMERFITDEMEEFGDKAEIAVLRRAK
ncbi:MAG: methyl-accepting chemotaxis protein [Synergistaceae bacterium]|nr:methyl-accepting chemotaxis protein [Synergistaceae bacterium]